MSDLGSEERFDVGYASGDIDQFARDRSLACYKVRPGQVLPRRSYTMRVGNVLMYERILLAYDGSREGRAALREGALLALRYRARVFLLAVQTGSGSLSIADGVQSGGALARQWSDFEAILAEGVANLKRLKVDPVARLVRGEPTIEIKNFAAEVAADLIVVGHRRQSLLSRWWSGSSGAYLLDNVGCSVLIARKEISDDEFQAELSQLGVVIGEPLEPDNKNG